MGTRRPIVQLASDFPGLVISAAAAAMPKTGTRPTKVAWIDGKIYKLQQEIRKIENRLTSQNTLLARKKLLMIRNKEDIQQAEETMQTTAIQ